jgi:hypothetical protein
MPKDPRTEPREDTVLKNVRIHDDTTELDIFLALLPLSLSPATMLEIVRAGCERGSCTLKWTVEHIFSALCILFGGGDNLKREQTFGVFPERA